MKPGKRRPKNRRGSGPFRSPSSSTKKLRVFFAQHETKLYCPCAAVNPHQGTCDHHLHAAAHEAAKPHTPPGDDHLRRRCPRLPLCRGRAVQKEAGHPAPSPPSPAPPPCGVDGSPSRADAARSRGAVPGNCHQGQGGRHAARGHGLHLVRPAVPQGHRTHPGRRPCPCGEARAGLVRPPRQEAHRAS